jgi:hypothetical protein
MKILFSALACALLCCTFSFAGDTVKDTGVIKDTITEKLEKVLYPCVRVLSGNGGGSGTVVYSEDREGTGEFQTFVLTNHHVIDNLIHVTKKWDNLTKSYRYIEQNDLADVELFQYDNGGLTVTTSTVKAEIIAYIAEDDIALLRLKHPFQIKFVAKILPTGKHLRLFQEIYAVGCPLLVDPTFTRGEVTDLEYLIENKEYTGGTADIIWGNSGGSVMSFFEDLGDWYFCGIPSRGRGAPNGQFVTYLGYYITANRIRDFVIGQKLSFLVDGKTTPTECMEERRKMQKSSNGPSASDGPSYGGSGRYESEAPEGKKTLSL